MIQAFPSTPAPAPQTSFAVVELEGEQAFHSLHVEWDALWQESTDATRFQLWEWQYLYWKHVTPQAVPRFATLRDESGRCRAIAVMVRTRDQMTGLMTTGFVGRMRTDYNMFLAGKDVPESVGVDLLRTVVRRHRRRFAALSLTKIPADSWTARVIEAYCACEGGLDGLVEVSKDKSYTVRLPSTVDGYVASLGQRSRRAFGYDRRRLEKECGTEFRVYEGAEGIDAVIDQIEAIDISRWGAESMYRRPGRRAFERNFIKALAKRGLLLVFLLNVDGKPASFIWCALVRGVVEVDRVAHDPSFLSKLSVGKVAHFYAIEECIRRGYAEFDLGRGGEAYKSWLGAEPEKLLNFQVYRSGLDRAAQRWGAHLGSLLRKQKWLRNAYRKYVSG